MKKFISISFVLLSIIFWNCESGKPTRRDRVIIGVPSDAENLNPLYAFGLLEGNIRELLFLSLVKHEWNEEIGDLDSSPLLAEKWDWGKDSSSLTFYLRENIFWSDSIKVTAEDVLYSFDLYSDPDVNSSFYGGFENMYRDAYDRIELSKTFEIISPTKIKINFKPGAKPTLFDVDMPILPKHFFSKIPRKDLSTANIEKNLVTNGPYGLSSWKRNEAIILRTVSNSFLFKNEMVKELVFKIVTDENSRITQLKKGEIDLLDDVNIESIAELKKINHIKIMTRTGRDYDYIGWNNIEPELFSKSKKIIPHRFFGTANVRKALSYAINREEILREYLEGYGQLSFGPVSPVFKTYYNNELKPYEFNPKKAQEILTSEGWIDRDKNGTIEKNNIEFSFKLYMGSGNPRRDYASTVIKNNLRAIGIDVTIETMEMGAFINKLFARELDAYMAGWTIPIPIDLQPYWRSDSKKSQFNFSSFNNPEVDKMLDALENEKSRTGKAIMYKKIQEVIHENEPTTFLYWLDLKTAYDSKIENVKINPLGALQNCWEWRIKE